MVQTQTSATPPTPSQWRALDELVKRVDEDRWLSSRYAASAARRSMIALYAYNYELAKVRTTVSEPMLGAIRFQWWRDVLEEIEAGDMTRRHDVAMALNALISGGAFSALIAERMLDAHEAALESKDRALEPEALLMASAASLLTKTHSFGRQINDLAPAYAATRRGETKSFGPALAKVPGSIRPALAHAALRYNYAAGVQMRPMTKRAIILKAVLTGSV
ncbi:MAG: squalene/phytoene synthase family protein [Pseudomonadota bacterium]